MNTAPSLPTGPQFRQRCAASLTHPVTLLAVLVLLLNDFVFKVLWSNPWTTGKLSDLAWVVFAPPLLVTLLSPLAGGSPLRQRAAFLTAYIGLPALYAAFNTFAPLHDWIMDGFGLLTNVSSGSPLDVTDSLAIPFGLTPALWIWRKSGVNSVNPRARFTLIVVGVAVFATIATSIPPRDYGITYVQIDTEGRLLAGPGAYSSVYLGRDGGMTWSDYGERTTDVIGYQTRDVILEPGWGAVINRNVDVILESSESIRTPRGTYRILERNVLLELNDGSHQVVYSMPHWNGPNVWMQNKSTSLDYAELAQEPYGMLYHEQSGNIILAAGMQGVVVGSPDEKWIPVTIGIYELADLSLFNKVATLSKETLFWLPTVTVAFSFTLLALFLSRYQRKHRLSRCRWAIVFAAVGFSGLFLLVNKAFVVYDQEETDVITASTHDSVIMLVVGSIAGVFSLVAWLMECVARAEDRQMMRWREFSIGFVVINLLIFVVFVVWLQTGIPVLLAKCSALVLATLAVLALSKLCIASQNNSVPTGATG